MPNFTADAYLFFQGTESGGALTPTSNFLHNSDDTPVFDNGDNNADTTTDLFDSGGNNIPYSGFTINISGDDYAIFGPFGGLYFVPYFDPTESLASLNNTPVTQTITNAGDDAAVVNLCFAGGTQIATPAGERAVEDLRIGDMVTTVDGRSVPVLWIGRQAVSAPVNLLVDDTRAPVCIAAGALGAGLPHSDLIVSADHGMIIDGLVINAAALVNGDTIRFVPMSEMDHKFTYYHIETAAHDAILANGAPSETFVDAAGRAVFDNHAEYLELYGAERIIPEMPVSRIASARLLPKAIRQRLGIAADVITTIERNVA